MIINNYSYNYNYIGSNKSSFYTRPTSAYTGRPYKKLGKIKSTSPDSTQGQDSP